jgi:hypothetical protein
MRGVLHASRRRSMPLARVATIHPQEPIWQRFSALLPERRTDHPLGCPALASPRGSFSRSWCKSWSSEAPTRGSPTSLARRARCVEKARGVDRTWSDGATQADLPGGLRPPHRPRAFGGGRRLLHDLSPLRRGEGGKEPCGPRKTSNQALDGGVGSAFLTLGG